MVVQVSNVWLVWLIGEALGAGVPLHYYFVFVPMVSVLTLLPVSVNGMGVRKGAVVLFLAPLGVLPTIATALAFLWFAIFAATGLLGGAVYLFGAYAKPVGANPDPPEATEADGSLGSHSAQGRAGQLDEAA